MTGPQAGWSVEQVVGSAASFHARPIPEPLRRSLWVLDVDRPALVLGSSQTDDVVDASVAGALGVEVVRRRSGGGAVLLVPGEVLWVDVLLPAGDPLWEPDVGRSAWWLGAAWCEALIASGVGGPAVHGGPMIRNAWSALACFAGLGPGEVVCGMTGSASPPAPIGSPSTAQGPVGPCEVGSSGAPAKLVGISQRRTRAGARFQCALYRRHDPAALPSLLALDAASRSELTDVLAAAVATADIELDALLAALPA